VAAGALPGGVDGGSGGRTRQDIARDLDVSPRTLRRYVESYLQDGLSGLVVQWYAGPQPKISAEVGEEIVRWVREGPSGCGLERANWTLEELAHHLFVTHGIEVCPETMRQFCLQRNIRMYRPSYRFLRGDPDKQEQAAGELADAPHRCPSVHHRQLAQELSDIAHLEPPGPEPSVSECGRGSGHASGEVLPGFGFLQAPDVGEGRLAGDALPSLPGCLHEVSSPVQARDRDD
jgi:transposase